MEADDDRETPSLGQAFADARERQGLSRNEVAQRLHMSAWQIEALETGDYARLPKGPFLRGFTRNYAKVLGIDPAVMLERLAEATPRAPAARIVVPTQNIRFDPIGDRIGSPYVKAGALAVVFLSLGFAAMYWWLFIRPTPPAATLNPPAPAAAPGKPSGSQPTPRNLAAAPIQPPETFVTRDAPTEPLKAELPKARAAKAEPPKAEPRKAEPPKAEAPKSASARTLKMRFKGDSWVEVKDRSGRVLLSKLNTKGTEAEVSGRPPFNVIIGNAPDVQVLYDDREFPLEPHTRVAVARFTVD